MNRDADQPPLQTLPTSVLVLATVAAALVLPYAHVWLHGAPRLADLHVRRLAESGRIPMEFLHVVRQAAENRIEAQGLIDAILALVTILVLAVVGVAALRVLYNLWSVESLVRSAAFAVLAELAFLAAVYAGVMFFRDADLVRIAWSGQLPLDFSYLMGTGTIAWTVLRALSLGLLVKALAFAVLIRRSAPGVSVTGACVIAAISSGAIVVLRTVLETAMV